MIDVYNKYQMTQSQWAAYQAEESAKAASQRMSPNMWMYTKGYNPAMPFDNQYVYDSSPWQSNVAQTQEMQRQQAIASVPKYTNIDPAKTSGYQFASQLDSAQKNGMLDYMSRYNPSMTEYEYRKKFGLDVSTVKGSYQPVTYGSFGHSMNTAPVGSGDVKLANQAKVVTNSSGTKVATPSAGTTAKQSAAANQVKTSPTTTAAKTSTAGQKAVAAQTSGVVKSASTTIPKPVTPVKATPAPVAKTVTKPTTADLIKQNASVKENTGKLTIIQASPSQSSLVKGSNPLATLQKVQAAQQQLHYGQVQLADGTWINQYQKVGASTPNTSVPNIVSKMNYIPSAQQILSTHVTTEDLITKGIADQEASQAANDAARSALSGGVLTDKNGNAIQQISGRGINDLGQLITISTPVKATIESQQAVSRAYKDIVTSGKKKGGSSTPQLVSKGSYVRSKGQNAQDISEYYKNVQQAYAPPWLTAQNTKIASFKPQYNDIGDVKTYVALRDFKSQGPVQNALGDVYDATKDIPSLIASKNKISDVIANTVTKQALPGLTSDFEAKRNAAFASVGLESQREAVSKSIYANPLGNAAMYVGEETYNTIRERPVDAAIEAGKLYVEAEIGGAAINGLKLVGRGLLEGTSALVGKGTESLIAKGLTSGSESAASKLVSGIGETNIRNVSGVARGVLSSGAKMVNPVVDNTLEASLVLQGKEMYDKSDYEGLIKNAGMLALSAPAFEEVQSYQNLLHQESHHHSMQRQRKVSSI